MLALEKIDNSFCVYCSANCVFPHKSPLLKADIMEKRKCVSATNTSRKFPMVLSPRWSTALGRTNGNTNMTPGESASHDSCSWMNLHSVISEIIFIQGVFKAMLGLGMWQEQYIIVHSNCYLHQMYFIWDYLTFANDSVRKPNLLQTMNSIE